MLKKSKVFLLLFILSIILSFIIVVKPIISGNIPFWYDPGRDLLLAWDNLRKPTLIGPTTGIQGVFYGPFWIWLLSIALLISKDPRIVDFIVLTIPYFTILTLILWGLSKNIFNKKISYSLWLLLILSCSNYANQIWSPNLAPLVFLIICFLIVSTDLINTKVKYQNLIFLGMLTSFLLSFLFSLTMVVPVSVAIYFLINFLICLVIQKNNIWQLIKKWTLINISYFSGVVICLLPTILFEVKHGFNQTKALLNNLTQGYINKTTMVAGGLNQKESVNEFISRLAVLTHLSNNIFILVVSVIVLYLIWQLVKKKIIFKDLELRILLFIFTTSLSFFLIFFTSKNPVFGYRFTGVEILSLFLIGLTAKKIKIAEKLLFFGAILYLFINLYSFINSFNKINTSSDLASRVYIVNLIYKDAGKNPFAYYAKNAAIYTFDYDYLFRWISKKYGFLPENNLEKAKSVYLIIPKELLSDKKGFTENRTPNEKFITIKEWPTPDGSIIVKRRLKE